jgi:hypothetical protein
VQAKAGFALAKLMLNRADWCETLNSNGDEIRQQADALSKHYGPQAVADVKQMDLKEQRREAETLLGQLIADERSAATKVTRDGSETTLGHLVKRQLFQLKHLRPGKPTPA